MAVVDTEARPKSVASEVAESLTVEGASADVPSVGTRLSDSEVGDLRPPVETLELFNGSEGFRGVCPRLSAMLLLKCKFMPGKPSLVSCRGPGVAVGSIDTADRMGNTRSIEPGLKANDSRSVRE